MEVYIFTNQYLMVTVTKEGVVRNTERSRKVCEELQIPFDECEDIYKNLRKIEVNTGKYIRNLEILFRIVLN